MNPVNAKRIACGLYAAFALLGASVAAPKDGATPPRRPIDNEHPLWLVHIDVWNGADPQKIIDLVPEEIRPWVCMNLSLSCQYDPDRRVHKMPQNAVATFKSWASVCLHNGMWFTCQHASGGYAHLKDSDLETYEYFFRRYPNFLGWNFAEQFWGFDDDHPTSAKAVERIALFAKLVRMSHKYGGFLTVSYCGTIYAHSLNPLGMLKRNEDLARACREFPDAILWLDKYTTSACFHNTESVTIGPFLAGMAQNYGVRYDFCGWTGAMDHICGEDKNRKYPVAFGIAPVLEQTLVNGGAVWDGPELIWVECFKTLSNTRDEDGWTRRNWAITPAFRNIWLDVFSRIREGGIRIPSRDEVLGRTKVAIINDIESGSDEARYAAPPWLYDGLYKQTDPMNPGNGWMDKNHLCYKRTGRYAAIPVVMELEPQCAKRIPLRLKKSSIEGRWSNVEEKVREFDALYPEVSKGDLCVTRMGNQILAYTPYSNLNEKKSARAEIPLEYNTCEKLYLELGLFSNAVVRESKDRFSIYLNNYLDEPDAVRMDVIAIRGAKAKPVWKIRKRAESVATTSEKWDSNRGIFMLRVKHNGPVDIAIASSGKERRKGATASASAASVPLPAPKAAPRGGDRVIIECEDMDFRNIARCETFPYAGYPDVRGHAGNGFADMGTSRDGELRHVLKLDKAGQYALALRYTNTDREGQIAISVNGRAHVVKLDATAKNEWRSVTLKSPLVAGSNTVVIRNADGIAAFLDQLHYIPAKRTASAQTSPFGE